MQPSIRLEHHLVAVESEQTAHVMVELAAPDAPVDTDRPSLHLALVIDRSGSMHGEKLEATKACAAFLAERLAPDDELAVIAYDNEVTLVAPLGRPTPDLVPAIRSITCGGSTNLSGGWLKAREVLGAAGPGIRKILLLTDGQANIGITDPSRLVGMTQKAAGSGIGTTTIGFGDDFDETLLTAMADAGTGNAHHAATVDAAPGIFNAEFDGLAAIVAQNVSVELRPSQDVAVVAVLNGYPATQVPGGLQLALGDAYGGDRRSVVFSLHLPALATMGPAKVADVVLRYVAVGEPVTAHEVTLPVFVNVVTAADAAAAGADQAVTDEVLILDAARARDTARKLADEGRFDEGQQALRECASALRSASQRSAKGAELTSEAERLEELANLTEDRTYSPSVQKSMHYQAHTSRRRRS